MKVFRPAARAVLSVVLDGFGEDGSDSAPQIIHVLPKSATVHRNSYRQADSWEVTLDANDLPFHPQLVRLGAAEIYLFQAPADGHDQRVLSRQYATSDDPSSISGADAMDSLRREQSAPSESTAGATLDELTASMRQRPAIDNPPTVVGRFDSHALRMSDDGKWVTISGQDYTAYLAAKQWPPTARHTARRIPTGKRLDRQLAAILADAEDEGILRLVVEGVRKSTLPVVGAKDVNTNKRGIPVEESTSYWDVMYKLATHYGFIIFVRGLDVVLTRPRSFDGRSAQPKRLAWGGNLENLEIERRLGREKVPRIVVRGYDPATRQIVTAEYPDTGLGRRAKSKIGPGGEIIGQHRERALKRGASIEQKSAAGAKGRPRKAAPLKLQDEYEIIPIFGATDTATLKRIAESIHRARGQAECKIVAVTHDLRDMRESSLMDLATGDAVAVDFNDFNRELLSNPKVPTESKKSYLISRGFGFEVAQIIAQHYELLLMQQVRPFQVHEVTYEYDVDEGIRIEMELHDFAVVDGNRDGSVRPRRKRLPARGERALDRPRPITGDTTIDEVAQSFE
jgi:hypothetical protein